MARAKKVVKENALKTTNYPLWKSRQLRSSFLTRLKKVSGDDYKDRMVEVPKAPEIEKWLIESMPFKCAYTGEDVPLKSIEVDHADPVSRGGAFD